MKRLSLVACVLLLLGETAQANTGVFSGSGHTIRLSKSADVQMVSEDVTITPIAGPSPMGHWVQFRCEFALKNRSDKAVKIQAGFPLDRESRNPPLQPSSDIDMVLTYKFIARDESTTYHVRYESSDAKKDYAHVFLWDMTFAPNETKNLHVGYTLPMSCAAGSMRKRSDNQADYEKPWHVRIEPCVLMYLCYVTETGQSWAGPIEKAAFRIETAAFENSLREQPYYVGGNIEYMPPDDARLSRACLGKKSRQCRALSTR